jgi:4-amino-4-deoxy-L-arabinose transferase-like glycosyltransferase
MTEAVSRAGGGICARLRADSFATGLFCLLSFFVLFHNLGGAALFDPDEGRNAEIAREILVTGDWVTPYYDFLPRLEKPVFFYAITALSYKLFGISEAAARFPSAASAFAALLLVYFFTRRLLGAWPALWSGLVLLTCLEFSVFSRIVILDMPLAFFITLALSAFYLASTVERGGKKRAYYFLMYAALGCATLVKGPIGVVIPGMIVAVYLIVRRKWSAPLEMEPGWGIMIFFLIVAPWYVWAEVRRPGYLAYFLGQEHFARYLTPYYQRTKPWYYFFVVLAGGFFPWTFFLPCLARRLWKKSLDDFSLYLFLWTVVPFVFFSFSRSKMAEYLLPVYPALAILAGKTIADALERWEIWLLSLAWQALNLVALSFLLGFLWPQLLPAEAQEVLRQFPAMTIAAIALLALIILPWTTWTTFRQNRERLFPPACLAFFLFFLFAHRFVEPISFIRSYKELAATSAPLIRPGDQLVIYDSYLPSLPFYLRIDKPIWIVSPEKADEVMGSFYVAEKKPPPAPGYGQVVFTPDEFAKEWSSRKLLVFIKERRLSDLRDAKVLLRYDGIALATNR